MQELLQNLLNGIAAGSIYALIALGYTMVYGILKLINFAHGDVFMLGSFVGFYAGGWAGRHAHAVSQLLQHFLFTTHGPAGSFRRTFAFYRPACRPFYRICSMELQPDPSTP